MTKTVYYIAITRDDDREFQYSTEIYNQEISDEEYEEFNLDENNIALYLDAEEKKIVAVSRSKECIDSFLTGISFEYYKEEEWNDMFDNYIDDNQSF